MISRAAGLLKRLTESGAFTTQDMARELSCSIDDVQAYIGGALTIPLSKQHRLALLVIEQSPRFVRSGHALKAQVTAAMAYESQATSVHNEPPTKWTSNKRRH
jgi:hypothetical protein